MSTSRDFEGERLESSVTAEDASLSFSGVVICDEVDNLVSQEIFVVVSRVVGTESAGKIDLIFEFFLVLLFDGCWCCDDEHEFSSSSHIETMS